MNRNDKGRLQLLILRVIVYAILIFLVVLCLFFFYLMVINASRSNAQLNTGFTLIPREHFIDNLVNAWNDASINIPRGMLNSLIIALTSAVLTTYFSALTAYGIHVYNFRGKTLVFTFIMAVMMIPAQVSALGFVQMMNKIHLNNSFIPLIIPSIAAPVVFYPQVLKNVRVKSKPDAQNDPDVKAAVDKVAKELGDTGRILVRESGTEPVIRVMVEAESDDICEKYVDSVIDVIKAKGHLE